MRFVSRFVLYSAWGALVALALPPYALSALAWVGLVPLYRLSRAQAPSPFWAVAAMSVGFSTVAYHWIAAGLIHLQSVPPGWASLAPSLYGIIALPHWYAVPLSLRFAERWRPHVLTPRRRPLIFALLYAGFESALPRLTHDPLGYVLGDFRPLRLLASLGGVALLSFVLAWGAGAMSELAASYSKKDRRRASLLGAGAWVGAVALSLGFGLYRQARLDAADESARRAGRVLQWAILQPGDFKRGTRESSESFYARLLADTNRTLRELPQRPDAWLWPESSYFGAFNHPRDTRERAAADLLSSWQRSSRVPLWLVSDEPGRRAGSLRNTMSVIDAEGEVQSHEKAELFPGGETLPGITALPMLWRALGPRFPYEPGTPPRDPIAFRIADGGRVRAAPSICYEDLFYETYLEPTRRGAELLINATNDGWFDGWSQPAQHLALARFRAIETGRPLLRATNDGLSALIRPDGEIEHVLGMRRRESRVYAVARSQSPLTPFVRGGHWFVPMSFILALAFIGVGPGGRVKRRPFGF